MTYRCLRQLVITGLLCLLFAGCSSSQNESTSTKTLGLKKVSLQLQWVAQVQFAGYYVALEKGWYREEGLDLTIFPGGSEISAIDLVVAGKREFGTGILADLMVAIEQKKPIISISQIQQSNGLLLVAKKSSGIESPKDFIGKKVGVWLGSWEAQFNALMSQQNIAEDKLNVISQGWSMQPFIEGRLDVASAMIYNEYYTIIESGIKADDLTVIDYADYNLDFPGDALFASSALVKEDPDLCTRMVRATLRGWKYALIHQEEAVDIVLKYDKTGIQTREHQLKMMMEIARLVEGRQRHFGKIDSDTLTRLMNRLRRYEILKSPLPPKTFFTDKFVELADMK